MVDAPLTLPMNMLAPDFTPAMLVAALDVLPAQIADVTANSREARRGAAFLAYRGAVRDGRDFIPDAIARGVSVVLYDPENFAWNSDWKVPCLAIPNLKSHASHIAGHVYEHPGDALWMSGVTGTNGKTSVAQWIAQGLQQAGRKSAVLGTIGNGMVGHLAPSDTTTLDAVVLQRHLRDYAKLGQRCTLSRRTWLSPWAIILIAWHALYSTRIIKTTIAGLLKAVSFLQPHRTNWIPIKSLGTSAFN